VEVISELIASPSILLLDEPTSGLDSSIAFEVMSKIRDLVKASDGKLSVILSVHQPNSALLELFDHLLLLDSDEGSDLRSTLEERRKLAVSSGTTNTAVRAKYLFGARCMCSYTVSTHLPTEIRPFTTFKLVYS